MTDLCIEFGISRKTGYKIWTRFKAQGFTGIMDQSRRPHHLARSTRADIQEIIVATKRAHLNWGATKIRDYLLRNHPGMKLPVRATMHAVLDKHGLVKARRLRHKREYPGASGLTEGLSPNLVWSTDYKGQFKMRNGKYCYPLTIADHCTRFLIGCEALENTRTVPAQGVFTEIFEQYGLPEVIRSDNGTPFASAGLLGLSRLAVWWMKLGISVEHTEPGHPQQNGRHERMHLTLKQDVKIAENLLQQQERFDEFQQEYNHERSHEALKLKRPGEVYVPSPRKLPRFLEPVEYPEHDLTLKADSTGRISFPKLNERIFISHVLAGENLGLQPEGEDIWCVMFKNLNLGFLDLQTKTFSAAESGSNKPKVSPMSLD